MSEREQHIANLFTAELQFRLATAVRLAASLGTLPVKWVHGNQSVKYSDVALRSDQADYAAHFLLRSATYLMAVAVKDAIRAVENDPKTSAKPDVVAAYQISRLIRNAFAHAPFAPTWSIDPDCRNRVFEIRRLIKLDTTDIDGKAFDWRQYGGPLALYNLCRFTRTKILGDARPSRKTLPKPKDVIYQQGDLILKRVDRIPDGAKRVKPAPDGRLHLGGGHYIRTQADG
jgi:hypothetical protein